MSNVNILVEKAIFDTVVRHFCVKYGRNNNKNIDLGAISGERIARF